MITDHREHQQDENFLCNGLISADYTPQPTLWEVKYAYQYVRFIAEDLSQGLVRISNYHDFINLSGYEIFWSVTNNEKVVEQGVIPEMSINPQKSKVVNIPYNESLLKENGEYFLNFSVRMKNDMPFRPAGFEVTHDNSNF
ncbi:MAG: DUF4981 domain-containing protein [Ignavibacteriales bacterium]|nr:DUF4981 domain-containing protein [Ignavibacteriales bacterium]